MDIGTAGHTAFEYDESVIDVYEKNPEYMECRLGLIHSHNTMTTFFSGEDMEELEDNTVGTDFYVSLIVNNASKYTAKIAWRTDEQVAIETTGWFKGKAIKFEEKRKNSSLYTIDLDIEIEGIEDLVAIDARLLEIEEAAKLAREAAEIERKAKIAENSANNSKYPKQLPSFAGKQLSAFSKGGGGDKLGFENLREIETIEELREYQEEINSEEIPPMEGEVFDNLIASLLVLDIDYESNFVRAMQEVKDKVIPENIPMLIEMITDNIEDYYEKQYGELCTMEAYLQICSSFIKELRKYGENTFPVVIPLINALGVELGEDSNGMYL